MLSFWPQTKRGALSGRKKKRYAELGPLTPALIIPHPGDVPESVEVFGDRKQKVSYASAWCCGRQDLRCTSAWTRHCRHRNQDLCNTTHELRCKSVTMQS